MCVCVCACVRACARKINHMFHNYFIHVCLCVLEYQNICLVITVLSMYVCAYNLFMRVRTPKCIICLMIDHYFIICLCVRLLIYLFECQNA